MKRLLIFSVFLLIVFTSSYCPCIVHAQTGTDPIAYNDGFYVYTDEDNALTLRVNDPEYGPGPFSITITRQPAQGTLTNTAWTKYTYRPNQGYTGTDSFEWVFSDGAHTSSPATVNLTVIPRDTRAEWFMAGANPQRTSWVSEEVRGSLSPEWYVPIEPYIPYYYQVIAADDKLFISTARGLYVFAYDTGTLLWVYPTELPLGHEPTVIKNNQGEYIVYVGGFDKQIHAIKANPQHLITDPTTNQPMIDKTTNDVLWTFDSVTHDPEGLGGGFNVNPLVITVPTVGQVLYAGNRNGIMYAINAETGVQEWQYKTNGSITFSAAASTDNKTLYIASNDSYGYAFDATDGTLRWKTNKLPGAGFLTWWPVVTTQVDPQDGQRKEYVILSGSINYRAGPRPEVRSYHWVREIRDLYPGIQEAMMPEFAYIAPQTQPFIDWPQDTYTIDVSKPNTGVMNGTNWSTTAVSEYLEEPSASENSNDPYGLQRNAHKPWVREFMILDAATGDEYTTDFDQDNLREYPPILRSGRTHANNRYPPVIPAEGDIYTASNFQASAWIPKGSLSRWRFGSSKLGEIMKISATDEARGYSSGGYSLYHTASADSNEEQTGTINMVNLRTTTIFGNNSLNTLVPGYDQYFTGVNDETTSTNGAGRQAFGGINGVYGKDGNQSPPIPYKDRVYIQRGNSLIAFKENSSSAVKLSGVKTVLLDTPLTIASNAIQKKLETEIVSMVNNPPPNPGFYAIGLSDGRVSMFNSEDILDYWHSPFDTIYVLLRAYPHVNGETKTKIDQYLSDYYFKPSAPFAPWSINHIGWNNGNAREAFNYPPEVQSDLANFDKQTKRSQYNAFSSIWDFNPQAWYAMWQYAKHQVDMGHWTGSTEITNLWNQGANSTNLMTSFVRTLNGSISDNLLTKYRWAHNGYIAGFTGFTNLYDLAVSRGMSPQATVAGYTIDQYKNELSRLKTVRAANFILQTPYPLGAPDPDSRTLNSSQNFIFMVPETANYLHDSAFSSGDSIINFYNTNAPYWFISKFDVGYLENGLRPLYDYHSLFQAKAQILKEPYEELVKYLDVPAVERGDLFYIDNLVSLLEAPSTGITVSPTPNGSGSPTPTSTPSTPGDTDGDTDVDIFDYNAVITDFGKTGGQGFSVADFDGDGDVDIFDYNVVISNFGR